MSELPEILNRLKSMEDIQDEHGRRLITIAGEDGTNGKLATLGLGLSGIRKILIAVGVAALGALGTAGAALWSAADSTGYKRAEMEWLRATVERQSDDIERLERQLWRPAPHPVTGDPP